jgi:hypothetical protein
MVRLQIPDSVHVRIPRDVNYYWVSERFQIPDSVHVRITRDINYWASESVTNGRTGKNVAWLFVSWGVPGTKSESWKFIRQRRTSRTNTMTMFLYDRSTTRGVRKLINWRL